MNHRPINRRTMLKGLGTATIGLPLLEEMLVTSALAAPKAAAVPVRALNVFFGFGIPAPLQEEGFDGVLEPLRPLSEKLFFMRGVDHVRCDESGVNAHYDGITISTESGDGRHDNVKRELSGVFHAITSAGGRFKTGQFVDVGAEGLDVYNTMLDAMGATRRLGPADREPRAIDKIRA